MPPTKEELDKPVNALASEKAPGTDGIPPETLKTGKPAPMQHLYKLLCLCKKTIFLKVCGTPSLYARRRTIAVIVTTVVALRSSVLLGRPLLEFLSAASKNLHHVFTLSPSTAYDLGALRLTWFSDYAKYRRSVGSSVCLTALRS